MTGLTAEQKKTLDGLIAVAGGAKSDPVMVGTLKVSAPNFGLMR